MDTPAGRIGFLPPEQIGWARRQTEAAVHAVVEEVTGVGMFGHGTAIISRYYGVMRRLMPGLVALLLMTSASATASQSNDRATVLVFISTECPYSNRYAPEIQRLYREFAAKDVRFWLVYPSPADTPALIARHLRDYLYPDIVLRDRSHPLLKSAKPTVTPEAFVFDASRKLAYHGRIDDRFVELMRERPAPTTHDLEYAVTSVLAGKPVSPAVTQAVGCFIGDMR